MFELKPCKTCGKIPKCRIDHFTPYNVKVYCHGFYPLHNHVVKIYYSWLSEEKDASCAAAKKWNEAYGK